MTDEAELIERARAGDDQALVTLLERHGPDLRRSVAGGIPARHRAALSEDDVLQQTFADAFVDVARFVPVGEGAFAAWLGTLARHNLRDALRALDAEKRGGHARRVDLTPEDSMESFFHELAADSRESPSRVMAGREAAAALGRALERLPEVHRTVVQRYDLEGEPVEGVARALGRSTGAVYLIRHRAHRRLRELLGMGSDFSGISA